MVYFKSYWSSEEKVQLAGHMHELMTKYLKRLDLELHKFKMELEADNSGITGLIEKSKINVFIYNTGLVRKVMSVNRLKNIYLYWYITLKNFKI